MTNDSGSTAAQSTEAGTEPIGLRCEGLVKWFGGVQRSPACRSRSTPARSSRSWVTTAPARARWSRSSAASTSPTAARSGWARRRSTHLTPPTARALGIETVYQDLALCDNLGSIANVVLGQEPTRFKVGPVSFLNKKAANAIAKQRLQEVGIRIADYNVSVRRLSGGQRQAIAIARGDDARPAADDARRAHGRPGRARDEGHARRDPLRGQPGDRRARHQLTASTTCSRSPTGSSCSGSGGWCSMGGRPTPPPIRWSGTSPAD